VDVADAVDAAGFRLSPPAPTFPAQSAVPSLSRAGPKPGLPSTGCLSRTRTAQWQQQLHAATTADAARPPRTATTSPRQVAVHRPAAVRTDVQSHASPAATPRVAAPEGRLPQAVRLLPAASAAAARQRASVQQQVQVPGPVAPAPPVQLRPAAATRPSGPPTPVAPPADPTPATAAAPAVPPAADPAAHRPRRPTNGAAANPH
jgi:hypothetical protein